MKAQGWSWRSLRFACLQKRKDLQGVFPSRRFKSQRRVGLQTRNERGRRRSRAAQRGR